MRRPRGRGVSAIRWTSFRLGAIALTPLLWFHSCNRKTVEEFVDVLRHGPAPAPAAMLTTTKQLELKLAIAPTRVYCFLGRTSDAFGEYALAFQAHVIPGGEVSPFDTGGLVKHIAPIRDWPQAEQQGYLRAFTWPCAELEDLLATYPGVGRASRERYLDVRVGPAAPGPHALWGGRIEAQIWDGNRDWRAWTWEGRWPKQVPVGAQLVAWTCSPVLLPQILDVADRATGPTDQNWFDDVLRRRVDGGVGNLVAALHHQQVTG